MRVEVVASALPGAPRSSSPHRTPHRGVPEHARTLTHSTDRNDAPGLAYLARTGFFKLVHMKSLSAHALRSLMVGQRATLESQIRSLAAVLQNTIRRFQSPIVRKKRTLRADEAIYQIDL